MTVLLIFTLLPNFLSLFTPSFVPRCEPQLCPMRISSPLTLLAQAWHQGLACPAGFASTEKPCSLASMFLHNHSLRDEIIMELLSAAQGTLLQCQCPPHSSLPFIIITRLNGSPEKPQGRRKLKKAQIVKMYYLSM